MSAALADRGPDLRLGYLAVASSAILFSAKAVIIKICYHLGVAPVVLMTLRMLFAVPFFAAMAWLPHRNKDARPPALRRKDVIAILFLALSGYYLSSLFDMLGLQFVTAGMERLILYVYPTLVVLLSAWIFRKRIDGGLAISLAVTYLGIALAFGGEAMGGTSVRPYLGGFLILISAICYAFYLIVQGRMVHRVGPQLLTAYSMLTASVVVAAQFLVCYPTKALVQSPAVYGLALVLAVFSTVVPAWLLGYGVKILGAGRAAVASSVGPVSTFALAGWVLGERTGWMQLAGLILVLAGGLRPVLGKGAAKKAAEAPAVRLS